MNGMASAPQDGETQSQRQSFRLRVQLPQGGSAAKASTSKSVKETSKEYRTRIKNNPQLYKDYRASKTLRIREVRQCMTEEQKERNRILQRERQRKYRERLKQNVTVILEDPPPREITTRLTEKQKELKREKNRQSAQRMKAHYSHQKRSAVNKKRRERYRKNKIPDSDISVTPTASSQAQVVHSVTPTASSFQSQVVHPSNSDSGHPNALPASSSFCHPPEQGSLSQPPRLSQLCLTLLSPIAVALQALQPPHHALSHVPKSVSTSVFPSKAALVSAVHRFKHRFSFKNKGRLGKILKGFIETVKGGRHLPFAYVHKAQEDDGFICERSLWKER